MSIEAHSQTDLDYSRRVFTDPANYAPFSHSEDGRLTLGCIDPRATDEPFMPVILQTSGGEAGLVLDDTLACTALVARGTPVTRKETAINWGFDRLLEQRVALARRDISTPDYKESDKAPAGLYLPQVHSNGCRLMGNVGRVFGEIATPADFTKETVRSFWSRYGLADQGLSEGMLRRVSDAAKRKLDEAERIDGEEMLAQASAAYDLGESEGTRVVDTPGENLGALYIINHTTDTGLNRQRIHRDLETPIRAQAYHATPLAVVEHIIKPLDAPKDYKALRVAALMARTAVVRAVLTDHGADPLELLDVSRDNTGQLIVKPDRTDLGVKWGLPE